jgi:hypothetical protein
MFSELSKGWETLALAIEEADATFAQSDMDEKVPAQLRAVPT